MGQTCKKPLAGVTVYLKTKSSTGGNEAKVTDFVPTGQEGGFAFDGVQEGTYTLVVAGCYQESQSSLAGIEETSYFLPEGQEKPVTISSETAARSIDITLDVERTDPFNKTCGVDRDCDGVVDKAAGGTDCKDDDANIKPKAANEQECNGLAKMFSTRSLIANSMAWTGSSYLLSDAAKSAIVTIDSTGTVKSTIPAGSDGGIADGIAWIGDSLSAKQIFAAVGGKILALSSSGATVSSFAAPSSSICSLARDGSTLWASDDKSVYKLSSSGTTESSFFHFAQAPSRELVISQIIFAAPSRATSASLVCPEITWDGKQLLVLTKATISAGGAYESTVSKFSTAGIKQTSDILVPARISGMAWVNDRLHMAASNAPTPVGETIVYEVLP
ncbi:MAG: hypothetical protein HYT87_11405 [Nitrospirae bacterium]|nr:hypothetical protein [Nitrospirota bacterium]